MEKRDQVHFWREQFDRGGNSIERWIDKARSLLDSADVLDTFHGSLLEELFQETEQRELSDLECRRLSVRDVSPMLRAMATECLLKALWLKQGGVLAENGAYRGILRGSEHQLDELAVAVGKRPASCSRTKNLSYSSSFRTGSLSADIRSLPRTTD